MNPEAMEKIAKESFRNYPQEIVKYVEFLFANREAAGVIPTGATECEGWQPRLNDCHNNVDAWCRGNKEFKPARGWLFYSLGYEADYVMFQQHSVLVDDAGRLVDITPSMAEDNYPFIYVVDPDEQFFAFDPILVNGNLFYVYR